MMTTERHAVGQLVQGQTTTQVLVHDRQVLSDGRMSLTGKMTPFEESIRVPMLIGGGHRWHYRNARRPIHPFNHVDLAPTSLGLCGIDTPACMQGFDYSATAQPVSPVDGSRRSLEGAPEEAYLQSVIPSGHGTSWDEPWRGIVTADGWKYVVADGVPMMLHDLNTDPYEQCNLAWSGVARSRRLELDQRLRAWIERTGDEFSPPSFGENGRSTRIAPLERRFADRWR